MSARRRLNFSRPALNLWVAYRVAETAYTPWTVVTCCRGASPTHLRANQSESESGSQKRKGKIST